MKLIQYEEYLVSSVDIGGLVFHQGISSHSADYTPMRYNCLWVDEKRQHWHRHDLVKDI